jgi:hypothetical protein
LNDIITTVVLAATALTIIGVLTIANLALFLVGSYVLYIFFKGFNGNI